MARRALFAPFLALSLGLPAWPNPGAAADLTQIAIQEWAVPAGSSPHDPAIAADGRCWYSGQRNNTIGWIDPKTGEVKVFSLPTPNSSPHGLVIDRRGQIWYMANGAGLIGKLDPATGKVTEYKLPSSPVHDPHTPIFDPQGMLWFTEQASSRIGRLNPETGEIVTRDTPTPKAQPHGIALNSKGVPFFDLFNTNKIGSIDPATLEITEYALPEGARPRRIAITPDDLIWYTDYARGLLACLDPVTKQVREFASPGGAKSWPLSMSVGQDGAIWFTESGVRPNTLVRFDLKTEKMRTWYMPSGGGAARNMVTAEDGSLWIACTTVNQMARVRIMPPK